MMAGVLPVRGLQAWTCSAWIRACRDVLLKDAARTCVRERVDVALAVRVREHQACWSGLPNASGTGAWGRLLPGVVGNSSWNHLQCLCQGLQQHAAPSRPSIVEGVNSRWKELTQ